MSFKRSLIGIIVRYPYRIMLASLCLIMAVGVGMGRLSVESGIDIFFSPDDPNLLAEQKLKRTYGREDNILIVVEVGAGDVFSPENLASIEFITEQSWQMPNSTRVDSITNYLYPEVEGDDIRIDPLIRDASSLDQEDIARIKSIALSRQDLVGRLAAPDARTAAVNVLLNLPEDGKPAAIAESATYAREVAQAAMEMNTDITVHLAGWAMNEQTLAEVTAKDSVTLMPLLFALVLVVMALLLGSPLASACTVIALALSIVTGMGFAGWASISINSVNVSAPTIIMTLAIADCVHVLTPFLVNYRSGADKREALSKSLEETLYPVTLTSITTALGFLTMNFSDSPPFRELGTIAAIGVIGALWVTVTVLPGLILLLPFRARKDARTGLNLDGLATFVIRRHKSLFWGSIVVIAVAISFIPRIELNDDPADYFSDSIPLSTSIEVIESKLSGTQSLHYSFETGAENGAVNPVFLSQVDEFVEWLRQQPEVVNVESFTDTLKRLNQVMHNDEQSWHQLPDTQDMISQYFLLYEISIPYGQNITHFVNASKSALKVSATLKNQKSQGLIAFEKRSQTWLQQNTPKLIAQGAGQSISFAHVGLRNIRSMLEGSLLAILLISACLILAFKSLRFGLVSFIPNLFPAFVTLGIWGAIVGEVNIAASVVFSITLGIIVDDTTHFLVKYLEGRRKGWDPGESIRYTFNTVGKALVSTSLILAIGFFTLVQSDFSVNSTSGLLVAATIVVAIILDLLFLPAVLIRVDRWLFPGQQDR